MREPGLELGPVRARVLELEQGSAREPVSAQVRGLERVLEPGPVPVPARVRVRAQGRALAREQVQA
ncbi:MAG: hypothetical protein IV092_00435 [Burkholderiaceae bacterium]|nr:hypothetical protein [Burkholderiaceae bacterium]